MYGARWCAKCQFNYFPWDKEGKWSKVNADGSHNCDPQRVDDVTSAKSAIAEHEKAIKFHQDSIQTLKSKYRLM